MFQVFRLEFFKSNYRNPFNVVQFAASSVSFDKPLVRNYLVLYLFEYLVLICYVFCYQVTESGKQEKHLVASVGKFSVIWNFQQVKNSAHHCYQNQQGGLKSCYCYKIVLKDESIIESRFMHDKFSFDNSPEAPLVVATPMKVTSFSMSGKK